MVISFLRVFLLPSLCSCYFSTIFLPPLSNLYKIFSLIRTLTVSCFFLLVHLRAFCYLYWFLIPIKLLQTGKAIMSITSKILALSSSWGWFFFNVTPFFDPINSSIFPYFVFSSIFIHHTCDRVCLGSIQKNFLFWAMFFTVHSIRHLQARPVCKYPSTLERILIFLFVLSPSPWVRNNQACWWTYWIIRKFCYLFRGKGYSAVTHLHFRSTKQRSVCTTINFARMCFGFAWYLTVPNDSEGKDRSWNIWTVENQKCFECSAQIAKLDHDSNPSTHQIICAPGESTD